MLPSFGVYPATTVLVICGFSRFNFEEEYYNTIKMGKDWGTLAKMSGITYFRLSSYEQKAFSGMIKDGLPNLMRTVQQLALRAGPFFLGTYLLMEWADAEYRRLNRKPYSH